MGGTIAETATTGKRRGDEPCVQTASEIVLKNNFLRVTSHQTILAPDETNRFSASDLIGQRLKRMWLSGSFTVEFRCSELLEVEVINTIPYKEARLAITTAYPDFKPATFGVVDQLPATFIRPEIGYILGGAISVATTEMALLTRTTVTFWSNVLPLRPRLRLLFYF